LACRFTICWRPSRINAWIDEEKLPISDIAAADIVETVPSALIILDRNLIITSANRAFYQTFRTNAAETEGCLIYDLGNRHWDIPALRTLLESLIPHRASV
jgi:PAS domain-containing protein